LGNTFGTSQNTLQSKLLLKNQTNRNIFIMQLRWWCRYHTYAELHWTSFRKMRVCNEEKGRTAALRYKKCYLP